MKSRSHYQAALAAEYALGTLRGAARIQFERKMHDDPGLAAEVARWQEAFTQLDNQIIPVIPPASVWKRIQHNLTLQPDKRPAPAKRPVRGYIGWALAAGLAALLLIPHLLVQPAAPTPVAILASSAGQQNGQWVVSVDMSTRSLLLTPLSAPDLAADRSLELWAIPPGGKPRSLGLLNTQQPTQLTLAAKMPDPGYTLAISLEPRGGSPTGQPTGAVLYSGTLSL
ncbi:anti-sigma factor [Rahnella contaminans]|jgi:anti-sigma-K factor RskA|uniref:anti-sigma factor n=1 Tax=Rahnella contaminans TaxID=2703882 RepID=UPI003C2AD928